MFFHYSKWCFYFDIAIILYFFTRLCCVNLAIRRGFAHFIKNTSHIKVLPYLVSVVQQLNNRTRFGKRYSEFVAVQIIMRM